LALGQEGIAPRDQRPRIRLLLHRTVRPLVT
jgi:hypothetical protein